MNDIDDVYTVDDYWDGPRQGVANFRGEPHAYECIFDYVLDDWSNLFRLTPLGRDALEFAIEAWEIWRRWSTAHHAGKARLESHPALPHERQRYFQLKGLLDRIVIENESLSFVVNAEFIGVSNVRDEALRSLKVIWHLAAR